MNEIINDDWILKNIFDSKDRINANMCRLQYLDKHPILKDYLNNRFSDSESISETIFRIKNNIEIRPVCQRCGGHIKFYKPSKGFQIYCSNKCSCSDTLRLEKCKITHNSNYGCDWPVQNIEIFNKLKQTKLERYGDEYGLKHAMQVFCHKYGVNAPIQVKEIKNKISNTIFEKYNVKWYLSSDKINAIRNNTDIMNKIYITKKKNHTFNFSKIEKEFKNYLEDNYQNDYEYLYKSELYPFNCDFYIKSLNLYIEIQGSWTHGFHPFDENNDNDLERLNKMKLKNTKYYNNAIITWTLSDVIKRNVAKENNLNYLEIFSNNLNKCVNELNKYIKNRYN